MVLIQGVGVHGLGWAPQLGPLSRQYQCLWFDNRGVGDSQPLPEKLSIELMAEDVLALMDEQGWQNAHIAGHSMGGVIAQQVATISPERVRSLAILCSFARWIDAVKAAPRVIWIGLRAQIGTRRMRRHAFLEFIAPPRVLARDDRDALAAELAPLFGHDLADAPPVTLRQAAALRAFDGRSRLAGFGSIPTLVINAEFDPIAPPAAGRQMAAAIPGALYEEIAEAAHGVPIHESERINALLMEHFERAEKTQRADATQ